MSAGNLTGGNPKPVCTICFEDLKPIIEDLQSIPTCGHVFHELCIQQWMEYCPSGKKPTCPVCKQSCTRTGLTRLYFQSTGDQTQLGNSLEKVGSGKEVDIKELEKEVRRLEGKVSALGIAVENREICIEKLNNELSEWKELAKREEAKKEEFKKEKDKIELHLKMKMEELSRASSECTKLQERSLGLAKELAALKLATDLDLGEEEMLKFASLGHGNNPENTIDVLKKSLALRNKSYKELMTQCNLLGRSDTRARKKLDKSKEKIKKLNERLQELEKALEEKENEALRNLKSLYKDQYAEPVWQTRKSNQENFSIDHIDHCKRSVSNPEIHDASTSLTTKENDRVISLETDSCFMEEDKVNKHLDHDSDFEKSPMQAQRDASEWILERKVTHVATSTWTMETLIINDISKQTPSIAVNNEAHTYDSSGCSAGGLFRSEGANRTVGKWCRSSSLKPITSNGELISVGSDGRGGRIKVLRDHDQVLDEKAKTSWPKKHKYGAKQSGQFRIENFFAKMES